MPIRVYDQTIGILKSAVGNARLGREEELAALKRLDDQSRVMERAAAGPGVEEKIAAERAASPRYGGRSVFGWEKGGGLAAVPRVPGERTLRTPERHVQLSMSVYLSNIGTDFLL